MITFWKREDAIILVLLTSDDAKLFPNNKMIILFQVVLQLQLTVIPTTEKSNSLICFL